MQARKRTISIWTGEGRCLPPIYRNLFQIGTLVVFFLLGAGQLFAETPKYTAYKRHNSSTDFPVNIIFDMVPDSLDFLWLGTNQGLFRFDGQNFKIFKTTDLNYTYTNKVGFMDYVDGEIIAMDEMARLEPMRIKTSSIEVFKTNKTLANIGSYAPSHIENISSLPKWLKDSSNKLEFIRYSDKRNERGYVMFSRRMYYYNNGNFKFVKDVSPDRIQQSVCIGNNLYYFQFKEVDGGYLHFSLKEIAQGGEPHLAKSRFTKMVDEETKRKDSYITLLQLQNDCYLYITNRLYRLFINENGELDGELLVKFDFNEIVTTVRFNRRLNKLFIGTGSNGFYEYSINHFSVLVNTPQIDGGVKSSSLENIFYQTQLYNDSLFFGLHGLFSKTGVIHSTKIATIDYHVYRTKGNKYIINKEGWRLFDKDLNLTQFNKEFRTVNLYGFDQNGEDIYLGINNYITHYKETKDSLKLIRKIPLLLERDYNIILYRGDSLLIGSLAGLYWLNLGNSKLTEIPGLKGLKIREVTYIGRNIWFVGTYGSGWYRYNLTGEVVKMPIDIKEYLNFVHCIFLDNKGYTWTSTNCGLFRFLTTDLLSIKKSGELLYYNYFSKENGFLINEFNGGGIPNKIRLKTGEVALPSMAGLVLFKPEEIPIETPVDRMFISDLSIDGKLIGNFDYLKLSPDFNVLQMLIFIPFYGNRYNLQVEYSLSSGSDTGKWTLLNVNGDLKLSRLEHGNYTLSFRLLSGFGAKKYIIRKFNFSVLPKWYQKKRFLVGLILIIGAIVYMLFLIRVRNIKQKNLRLEALVETRTSELVKSQEALKESYNFRSRVTSIILHDIRSPLHFLAKITERIYGVSKKEASDNLQNEIKTLHEGVVEIADYARNLMAWISTQEETLNLTTDLVDIAEIFNSLQQKYTPIATEKGIELLVNIPDKAVVKSNFEILHIVVRNILDNAIKYTSEGFVNLNVINDSKYWIIQIIDSGIGISDEVMAEIQNSKLDKDNTTFNKLGYRIIWDMLTRIKGELVLASEIGKGSKIEIKLPIL